MSSLSTLEKVLMTKRVVTRRSPKHRSLSRSNNKARDHKVREPGTSTRSRADPTVNRRRMVRSQDGRKTVPVILVHVGILAILGHYFKIDLKKVKTH